MIRAFISGIVDAGEDISWCVRRSNIPPNEIDDEIISTLRDIRVRDNALESRGTAKMIAKFLEANYGCDR